MKRVLPILLATLLLLPALAADYGDTKFERKGQVAEDVPPAYFPHWIHRIQYKCGACHEDLFKMKSGSADITMDGIKEGKACGACHNGKAAFEANFDTCLRCHVK